jgi:hypothetical protein
MTLYDVIMGRLLGGFTKDDWASLGRGEIKDEEQIKDMLSAGYGAMSDED